MNSTTAIDTLKPSDNHRLLAIPKVRPTLLQNLARRRVVRWLEQIQGGSISFNDFRGRHHFGPPDNSMTVEWTIRDPEFYSHLATGGSLGLAESYLRGHWTSNDLTKLLTIFCRNLPRASKVNPLAAAAVQFLGRMDRIWNRNNRTNSRRQIASHYDLSNDFFSLFLDSTMMYSSAYFESEDATLHDASIAKLGRICDKLELGANDHVLEIGTGWGGFALYAVQQFGIKLTTTTISAAQLEKAGERFRAAGIEDRVELLDCDYRDLSGQFDKVVSIEMIEAVGERYLDEYFERCGQLLKPGGRLVIQAIVMPEQRYDAYRGRTDFIQKYIFPGGFLPSVAAMQRSIGRTSNLRLNHIEALSSHYARTLQEWRNRFFARIDEVWGLGFDDRFIRMWEYYLCYCEAAFREQAVQVVQIVWDKPQR